MGPLVETATEPRKPYLGQQGCDTRVLARRQHTWKSNCVTERTFRQIGALWQDEYPSASGHLEPALGVRPDTCQHAKQSGFPRAGFSSQERRFAGGELNVLDLQKR
jgi:hypothetical protein